MLRAISVLFCCIYYTNALQIRVSCNSAPERATAFALEYGTPLAAFAQYAAPMLQEVGTNSFIPQRALANASTTSVVRPNVDTLYTTLVYDLSHADLAITLPPIDPGRFYVFPFYDPYGDNYANLGSVNNSLPGQYLLRVASSAGAQPGFQTESGPGNYTGYVSSPSTYGSIVVRILVRNESDIAAVNDIQDHISATPIARSSTASAPPLSFANLTAGLSNDTVESVLQLTARLAPWNLPEVASNQQHVACNLQAAGVADGTYTQPQGVDLGIAAADAQASQKARLSQPGTNIDLGNGWTVLAPSLSGNFGVDYEVRAFVAETGYLQLDPYEAIYPTIDVNGSTGALTLGPREAYVFTFSARPPVTGFWSLTAYGSDEFLVPNPMNVYSLSDRSNLTYGNGESVYGDSSTAVADGPFQVLLQPADVSPPANWTRNWLPIEAGGGNFSVNLRWYGPTDSLSNGSYAYPSITKVTALSAGP
ncbi:hypothetical protein DENSPDRAFT_415650 [Dentipellis sp. KUC8613]|nr:hypothetical protein DENSPDRAFT_415650 [Dentipellis sp. KUC8613]